MVLFNDMCEKYIEFIFCVLGNVFIFGDDVEKLEVSDIILVIVDMVMEVKGIKRGFFEFFFFEIYDCIM